MAKVVLTEEQIQFLERFIANKNYIQKKIITSDYKDYLGRRNKVESDINVLLPGSEQRTAQTNLLRAADEKAEQGDFKGAYNDLKTVKIETRKLASGVKSSISAGSLMNEIAEIRLWSETNIRLRDRLVRSLTPGYDDALAPLQEIEPVSVQPDLTGAVRQLEVVQQVISRVRLALAEHKARSDLQAQNWGRTVSDYKVAGKLQAIAHKTGIFASLSPGNDRAPIDQAREAALTIATNGGLTEGGRTFRDALAPLYRNADVFLSQLIETKTSFEPFRDIEKQFTDDEGNTYSEEEAEQQRQEMTRRFGRFEQENAQRIDKARMSMLVDGLQDDQPDQHNVPPIQRLPTFDTLDFLEEMIEIPPPRALSDQQAQTLVTRATEKLRDTIRERIEISPNDDVLFDMMLKTRKDWAQEIAESFGFDLDDPNADPSRAGMVDRMAGELLREMRANYPNQASNDLSVVELNGESFSDRRLLGAGGGGEVYLYTSEETGRQIVVKQPRYFDPNQPPKFDELGAACRESRNHREVTGGENGDAPPNVLGMEGIILAPNGMPLLAMELADGGDAEDFSNSINAAMQTGLISPKAQALLVQETIRQMALGIQQMQDKGMSHHDLKEANVFMMMDGTVKIADFGIANILEDREDEVEMSENTPGYEPDELLAEGKLGQKGDNFTLGVILDKMTNPTRGFEQNSPENFGGNRLVRQPTTQPGTGENDAPEVIRVTALDRLRNQLLSLDKDERPDMAGVLSSSYFNEVTNETEPEDLEELRLATMAYAKAVGSRIKRFEADIQWTEGEIRDLELKKAGKYEDKAIRYSELQKEKFQRIIEKFTRQRDEAVDPSPERAKFEEKIRDQQRILDNLDVRLNQLRLAQQQPKGDSELRELDRQIAQKRQQIIGWRGQIELVHQEQDIAPHVERLRLANLAFL